MHSSSSKALEAELCRLAAVRRARFRERRMESLRALLDAGFRFSACTPGTKEETVEFWNDAPE
jgi:hypothetical protein